MAELPAAEHLPSVTNSIGMKLVAVPAGEFQMGSTPEDIERLSGTEEETGAKKSEAAANQDALLEKFAGTVELTKSQGPRHGVTIGKPFHLGAYEVTQQDFQTVMGYNPSAHSSAGVEKGRLVGIDTKLHPVDSVSWDDAVEFCRQLSSLPDEVAAGRTYRLPTEAEWEYACRAGTTTSFYWGERAGIRVREQREYPPLSSTSGKVTWPVGKKEPNPWGFCDMTGNVVEWCADWYDPHAYQRTTAVDPQGPSAGTERVTRGAAINWQAHRMRSAARNKAPPDSVHKFRGFRVVCNVRLPTPVAPPPPSLSQLEIPLKQQGLQRHGTFYVLAEEAEFLRYVATLERMRAACFAAERECREIDAYFEQNDAAKSEAIKARMAAREYISYSDTWREHWNGVRAKHNAKDLVRLINLSKDDLQKWKGDAEADLNAAVARFSEQLRALRVRLRKIEERNRALADDAEVQSALAAVNSAGNVRCTVGQSAALIAAAKTLDTEESAVRQLNAR